MFFQHIYDKTLAQASYLLGCQKTGEAIVIDAKRDVDTYIDIAKQNNLRITHITETHIHADFLSGSRELAALTDAEMYLSDEGGPDWQYNFSHTGLRHGDVIKVGNLSLKVLHTPGHTPESITFLLTDHPASNEPVMMFTGDFVFVGDIGRPDLLEKAAGLKGTQEIGADQMYHSIKKFQALPDFIQVWPGHGAGSACGKALGAVPSTTVGYEKIRNWALQYGDDKTGFVGYLLSDQPEPPKYFAEMKMRNKEPRNLLTHVPKHQKLSPEELLRVQGEVDNIYNQFLKRVADGRKLSIDRVKQIARGRVWTGKDALAIGLVDEIGSLQDAINFAIKSSNVSAAKVIYYPLMKEDKFESLFKLLKDETEESEMKINLNSIPADLLSYYQEIKKIEGRMGIQMRMPFDIKFD